jgi:polar amino acid transport system substrate-binding protein
MKKAISLNVDGLQGSAVRSLMKIIVLVVIAFNSVAACADVISFANTNILTNSKPSVHANASVHTKTSTDTKASTDTKVSIDAKASLETKISANANSIYKKKHIVIGTGEYPPFSGAQLPEGGYANRLISEAFATQGITVAFVYRPWRRVMMEAQAGKYDATAFWYKSQLRQVDMLYSRPVIRNRTVFFQRQDDAPISWNELADLKPYRVGAVSGYTYTDAFQHAVSKGELHPFMLVSDEQGLRLLFANRIDVFPCDEVTGFYLASQLNIDPRKMRVLEKPLMESNGYLLAPKIIPESAELLTVFNKGFEALKQSGRYKALLQRPSGAGFYDYQVPETE